VLTPPKKPQPLQRFLSVNTQANRSSGSGDRLGHAAR
jgi:hypothetical protein